MSRGGEEPTRGWLLPGSPAEVRHSRWGNTAFGRRLDGRSTGLRCRRGLHRNLRFRRRRRWRGLDSRRWCRRHVWRGRRLLHLLRWNVLARTGVLVRTAAVPGITLRCRVVAGSVLAVRPLPVGSIRRAHRRRVLRRRRDALRRIRRKRRIPCAWRHRVVGRSRGHALGNRSGPH